MKLKFKLQLKIFCEKNREHDISAIQQTFHLAGFPLSTRFVEIQSVDSEKYSNEEAIEKLSGAY